MKRFLFLLLSLTVGMNAFAQQDLSYAFAYDTSGPAPRLLVTLRFQGSRSGVTELQLPESWASAEQLYKAVTGLRSETPAVVIDSSADPARRRLRHRPGAALVLRYELQQDWNGPLTYPLNYRAVLQQNWLQATGYALLVKPVLRKDDTVRLRLNWQAMPRGWRIANSFHSGNRNYTGRCRVGDLENTIFVCGDFRLWRGRVNGRTVCTAVRGHWPFADSTLQARALRIIGAERDFWNDHDEPYFLLTLAPFEQNGEYNGSALYHSFFLNMSADTQAAARLPMLLTHEYFHRWVGGQLLLPGREGMNYWFSEGFTEYYTQKLQQRLGLLSVPEYVKEVNSRIAEYYLSPVRGASQEAVADSFWRTRAHSRLPYTKGFTYALYLDALIQERSAGAASLDDVLRALRTAPRDSGLVTAGQLLALLRRYDASADSSYHEWIVQGRLVPVRPLPLAAAGTLRTVPMGAFELGFDAGSLGKGKPVRGVVEGSAAWAAGLRNGQLWQSYSIFFDDPSKYVELGVLADGKTLQLRYLPVQTTKVAVPQFDGGEANK